MAVCMGSGFSLFFRQLTVPGHILEASAEQTDDQIGKSRVRQGRSSCKDPRRRSTEFCLISGTFYAGGLREGYGEPGNNRTASHGENRSKISCLCQTSASGCGQYRWSDGSTIFLRSISSA